MTLYCEFSSKLVMGQTLGRKPPFRDHKEIFKHTCHRYCRGVCPGSEVRRGCQFSCQAITSESTYLPRSPAEGLLVGGFPYLLSSWEQISRYKVGLSDGWAGAGLHHSDLVSLSFPFPIFCPYRGFKLSWCADLIHLSCFSSEARPVLVLSKGRFFLLVASSVNCPILVTV